MLGTSKLSSYSVEQVAEPATPDFAIYGSMMETSGREISISKKELTHAAWYAKRSWFSD